MLQSPIFSRMKEVVLKKADEDAKFRAHVKHTLRELLGADAERFTKEVSRRNNTVIIQATNKVYAQELFIRKDALEKALGSPIAIA